MAEYKTIIDKDGNLIDRCVMFKDGQPQYFNLEKNHIAVERYKGNFVKPKLENDLWVETATKEEIKNYYMH